MSYTLANRTIENQAALAPMAGLTDASLRGLADEYGAAFTVSEMVSAKALVMGDKKTGRLCAFPLQRKGLYGIQLFGSEPEVMAQAAQLVLAYAPDFIDINLGCPAQKVVSSGHGSALMRTPALCEQLVRAAGTAGLPVTVKMRTGYDVKHLNAPEVARACEAGGAALIAVHGRSRDQQYTPPIHPEEIARVVQAVKIPVLGNGDILSGNDAAAMLADTGCAGVMVGRGALGNLWLFAEIEAVLSGKPVPPPPTLTERMELLRRQIYDMCRDKGEALAMMQARTQAAFYMKGLRGAASLRGMTTSLQVREDIDALCQKVLELNGENNSGR